jgi:hypothetical protein
VLASGSDTLGRDDGITGPQVRFMIVGKKRARQNREEEEGIGGLLGRGNLLT